MDYKYVCFNITSMCNMGCPYCYRIADDLSLKNVEYSKAEKYIDFLVANGCKTICITGGEPTLNPAWRDIIKYCKGKKLHIIFSTNGLNIDINDPIFELTDVVVIPLDGSTENINAHTRSEIQYQKAIEIINSYDASLFKFRLKINTVLTKYNCEDLYNISSLINKKGIMWKIFKLREKGYYYRFPQNMILSDDEFDQYINNISSIDADYEFCYIGGKKTEQQVNPNYIILSHTGNLYVGSENDDVILFNVESTQDRDINIENANDQFHENLHLF